ncbi:MAG TPA: 2-amino-4-hydroxy-6-hydroxymethyldihydropteridine diphosphokinase [Pseudonocardiaceae bacterium]
MTRAVLSIGSNLGDRLGHLRSVLDALPVAGGDLIAVSAVYETAPWGPVPQDDFLNAVVVAEDAGRDPAGWLEFGRACERRAGRTRTLLWGPRTLDVDIVDVDGMTSGDPELTLPHPRAAERAFVLVPWLDADPSARLAGVPVAELLAALDPAEMVGVRRREDLVLAAPSSRSGR